MSTCKKYKDYNHIFLKPYLQKVDDLMLYTIYMLKENGGHQIWKNMLKRA